MDTDRLQPAAPRRRRFQFSLRRLLIVVALVAATSCYLVPEARTVCARKAWLAAHPQTGTPIDILMFLQGSKIEAGPSLVRRAMGDKSQLVIWVDTEVEAKAARDLFPEAAVCVPEHLWSESKWRIARERSR
jgi:hypothetical protein